jgi:hypothetical protein
MTGEDLFYFLMAEHHEKAEGLIYLGVEKKMFLEVMQSTNPLPASQSWVFVHRQMARLDSAENT